MGVFSDRISDVPRSFIREILKVALDHSVISFAGGLPNRNLFPVEAIRKAADRVFDVYGSDVLQYANSEGFIDLREKISGRYKKRGLDIEPCNILITTGSQQGLDLMAKAVVNEGEGIVIEEPGYLGAIQAFSLYRPDFQPVPVGDGGMDCAALERVMSTSSPKLMYTVPNFQNPSGISYTEENRRNVAGILKERDIYLIEDDPYCELRYKGSPVPSFHTMLPKKAVLLGSFSKTIVPGFRLGWVVAPDDLMEKLLVAKQAADLHTTHYLQCLVACYLEDNDADAHISLIREHYGRQLQAMLESLDEFCPELTHTHPEGGMFIWAALPEGRSSRRLLDIALEDKVIFVPGDPFYVDRRDANTMRLNFSCMDENMIRTGIQRLGKAVQKLLK
jgi:2-aminoadipate transaminase